MSFDKVQEDIPFTMTARPPLIKAKSDFIARKPLQSIQVNSKADLADGSGSFKTPQKEKPVAKASLAEAKIENIEKLELPEVATTSTSSEISECSSLDQQASNEAFRSTAWMDNAEDEDMWTLKRASPVYDDQDEFYQYESPAKRSRSSLDWQDRLSDDIPLVLTLERH